ncbi:AAA family ATPase [Geothrix sp. 21YS21S-2]|uniref:nucleotide-binding protein n=1 Tax=Geothrix sp. 21YS21S-2 TaxID=3068893 RepID=UPI0027BA3DF3|nr:P-loop NTPase [Geothrix sp. 21YS21S-2]
MLIWAVGGGKGGTGKSLVSNGLAIRLAERSRRVVLVDADFGGANQHTYCGLRNPPANLGRFLDGKATLEELALDTRVPGLQLVPGNLNSANTDGMNSAQKQKFFRHLRRLEADHVILDLGAGTQYDTLDAFLLADVKVAVITPEPLSIENFYLFVKNLQFRLLSGVLTEARLRDPARAIWKDRAAHGIVTVQDLARHLSGLSETFKEAYGREHARLALHLVLNEVREFRQVDKGRAARSAVVKFFQVPTELAGFIHHDKDLWNQFGQGSTLVLKGASFALRNDLESILDGILKTRARGEATP